MICIPAIDLLDGKAVRLHQGVYDSAKEYSEDPVALVRDFVAAGMSRIHIVDLDAARGRGSDNRRLLAKMRKSCTCELEVGGGIRSQDDIKSLVDLGIDWLIVGTALVKDPDAVRSWVELSGHRVLAGIDAYDGKVKVSGWESGTSITDSELAVVSRQIGCSAIIYTNIARDGTLSGPDIERSNAIAKVSSLPVILSGGFGSMEHIRLAEETSHPGVQGFILGKAIYEGRVSLENLSRYRNTVENNPSAG